MFPINYYFTNTAEIFKNDMSIILLPSNYFDELAMFSFTIRKRKVTIDSHKLIVFKKILIVDRKSFIRKQASFLT